MRSLRTLRFYPWRELAILMIVLMEVSWVTPWFRSLTPTTYENSSLRVFVTLTLIVLLAHGLVRLFDILWLKNSVRRGVLLFFLVLSCLLALKALVYTHTQAPLSELFNRPLRSFADLTTIIPVEFIVILTVVIGFWRGITIAQEHIGPSTVMGHFWIGIAMYVAFIFLNTLVTGETPADFFYLFIFAALIAMSAARITVVGMVRGGHINEFKFSWFAGIVGVSLAVVGLSAILGGALGERFSFLGTILLGIVGSIMVLIWLVISPLVSFLIDILSRLFGQSQAMKLLGDAFQQLNTLFSDIGQRLSGLIENTGIGLFFSRYGAMLKAGLLIAIIAAVVLGVLAWMAIKLWRDRERRQAAGDERTNVNTGNLLKLLLELLRQGWMGAVSSVGQILDVHHRQRLRAAARIRQIYADLMELCDDLGHPRQEALTPLEFEPKLDHLFPDMQPEIELITTAYLGVRYGQLPETHQEVEDVEAAWVKLHQAGDELVKQLRHPKK